MKAPFEYGTIVTGKFFTNRENEINRLITGFESSQNIILISPRRWGKSSLIEAASEKLNPREFKIIICQDEYQNINQFKKTMVFQKRLRAAWQKHYNTSYCIYGSQTHMMMMIF